MADGSVQAPLTKRLEDKVAVITGGCSGIGLTTVRFFLLHGAKVVIADIQDDLGHSLCKELGSDENITYFRCDVTNETDVRNAVDATISKYGKLDIMFSNAGICGEFGVNIFGSTSEEFKRVFEINVYGSFLCAKHVARMMIPAKRGTIIFTASIASVIASNLPHAYTMSKCAVVGMAKNLCAELGQYGIRVNCVSPHFVATPMVTSALKIEDESKVEEWVSSCTTLKGVVLRGQDVAEAVVYLASDEAKYVSGLNLVVDGGFSTSNSTLPIIVNAVSDNDIIQF